MSSRVIRTRATANHDVPLALVTAARRYWLTVFPQVVGELRYWRRRACEIPDPLLREQALATHRTKSAHCEGAAAFATLVAPARRRTVVRALVAFQALYDYLDTISEHPAANTFANNRQLHRALVTALDPSAAHVDYYAHHTQRDDGGYLHEQIAVCRAMCRRLPSFPLVAGHLRAAAVRAMESQAFVHTATPAPESRAAVARWAGRQTHAVTGLLWWESAAAAGSSLTIHALLAVAADPALTPTRCGDRAGVLPVGGRPPRTARQRRRRARGRTAGNLAYVDVLRRSAMPPSGWRSSPARDGQRASCRRRQPPGDRRRDGEPLPLVAGAGGPVHDEIRQCRTDMPGRPRAPQAARLLAASPGSVPARCARSGPEAQRATRSTRGSEAPRSVSRSGRATTE